MLRQPYDGSRIETVGTAPALYFYRADTDAWMPAYSLTLDTEMPLNGRYAGQFGAYLGERLMEELSLNEPTPGFLARAARARTALFTRPGTQRRQIAQQYI